jgi:FkbM family methyltransferase
MIKLVRGLTIAVVALMIAAVALTVLGLVGLRVPAFSFVTTAVTAAHGGCSYSQIREGERVSREFGPMRAKMLAGMRKVREDGKYQLWSTPQGEFWYRGAPSELDAFVLTEEEFDIYRTTRIKPGAIVLDCGANYGTFTRRALLRGAARVVAIEINPEVADAMRRTFAKEISEGRVVVYTKGVWDRDTDLELRGDSVVIAREGPPVRVPVTTIDRIVSELQLPSVDFIKMDIEGAEKNALRGGKATLAKYVPEMALSSEHLPDDMERIPALVSELVPARYRVDYNYCLYDKPFHAAPNVIQFSK